MFPRWGPHGHHFARFALPDTVVCREDLDDLDALDEAALGSNDGYEADAALDDARDAVFPRPAFTAIPDA